MSTSSTGSDPGRSVACMLWDTAERVPESVAIVDRERSGSYSELVGRAGAIATELAGRGVQAGERVAVLLERGPDAAAAYFGVIAAGAVVVLVNDTLRPRQIEYILDHSGARVLLTSQAMLSRQHRPLRSRAEVIEVEALAETSSFAPRPQGASDLAQLIYTSGSTGLPKGVMASHANIRAAIETVAGYLGIRADDRIASLLPFNSVYGANQLLCAVLRGATLVIERSPVPNQIVAGLREAGATVLAGVPPLWMQLLNASAFQDAPITSLRILQNAGGHLAPAAVRRLRELQPQAQIFLQYGMTEVFRTTYLPPEELDRRPDSMGKPMPGVEVLVVREDLTPCAPGEVGELVHCGPTVTLGYWNDPERTARTYRPHPFDPAAGTVVFSGDMVRRDEEGFLYFVGRRDRMIKTLGFRVGPDEVLDVLYASGQIAEGLITTEPDPQRGEAIVAYVVLREGGSLDALRKFCRAEMPRYMQPTRIETREFLPRNANGKHDLLALRAEGAAVPTS